MSRPHIPAALLATLLACAAPAAPAAPTAPAAPAAGSGKPAAPQVLRVQGNRLVDGSGQVVQLRGASIAGLEAVAAQGWNPANPWGNSAPDFAGLRTWGANVVRLPLNEASWLGYECTDGLGKKHDPDPGHNYRDTVRRAVADATRAGLYVILDLHWTAPARACPWAQAPMADADNSPLFWTQVAGEFKSQPGVAFELFNEPFMDWMGAGGSPWRVLREGGTQRQYTAATQGRWQVETPWQSTGMQQLLDAVRATGATNVVLAAGLGWSRDLSGWLASRPRDPLQQLAAVWHAYPKSMQAGTPDAAIPLHGSLDYQQMEDILRAGFPLVITETGDHNAPGTRGAPFLSQLLPWADRVGASYLGWTFNAWPQHDYVLLKDVRGTPSDGYGEYFKAHLACLQAGTASCP